MPLTFKSVADLNRAIMANLHRLDRDQYDCIVGIPRSGMIPASIIATQLQLPLSDVESFARGYAFDRSGKPITGQGRVLLVDDTCNHGTALARASARIVARAKKITRFAVFGPYRGNEGKALDMFCEIVQGPRAFEWNMAKHRRLSRWGFDFDGVFCRDPRRDENDDGPAYERFLREAEPLFIPIRPVGHIVTCRLERYRGLTHDWLVRHGIEYEQLHMMPYATKAERMAAGNRGGWKAGIVKGLPIEFFIESSSRQGQIIARETGLPVWCLDRQVLVQAGGSPHER